MKAFTCPQCGASLEYERIVSATVRCHYCNSVVVVPEDLRPKPTRPPSPPIEPRPSDSYQSKPPNKTILALIAALVLAGGIGLLIIGLSRSSDSNRAAGIYSKRTPRPTPSPPPEGYTVAFTVGGEGTGVGLFKDELEVTVDGEGYIYVADDTLRVQRFDASGKFLNTWSIPVQTKWYRRLKTGPQKLIANERGELYAVLSGVVLKLDGESGAVLGAVHGSDYIHDATLIPGNGLLMVSQKGDDDEMVLMGGDRRIERRTHSFLSSVLDTQLEVAALRVAADNAGNTFALYALGDVYGEHWYDSEQLAVFKFTREGKYVARFGGSGREPGQFGIPSGIAVDNKGRVYVCEQFDKIHVYAADDGRYLRTLKAPHRVKSVAFDSQHNLYVAGGNLVSKLVLNE